MLLMVNRLFVDVVARSGEQGAWSMEQGAWSKEHGAWGMELGARRLVLFPLFKSFTVYFLWSDINKVTKYASEMHS